MSKKKFTKDGIIEFFHNYTKHLFIECIPDTLSLILDNHKKKQYATQIQQTLINDINSQIISDIVKKDGLDFGSVAILKKDRIKGLSVTKFNMLFRNNKQVYMSYYFEKANKIYMAVNFNNNDYSKDYPVISTINKFLNDNKQKETQELINGIKEPYSILVIDFLDYPNLIYNFSQKTQKILIFLKTFSEDKIINYYPIYGFNTCGNSAASFLHTKEDTILLDSSCKKLLNSIKDDSPKKTENPNSHLESPLIKEGDIVMPDKSVKAEILQHNPYDKNQYLRIIAFKEIPGKYFLQGRAKFDKNTTKFNIYDNSSVNNLVGEIYYDNDNEGKINVKWCS